MNWYEGLLLGLVQGLTEFLPVSSSGHLRIGRELLGIEAGGDIVFEVAVHAATVLSTIVVFRRQIWDILCSLFAKDGLFRNLKSCSSSVCFSRTRSPRFSIPSMW